MNEKKDTPYRRTAQLCGILLFSAAIFYAAVCTPIYQWSSADIAVSEVFTLIWDAVQNLVRFAFFWTAAAFVLVSVRDYERSRAILLLAGGANLLLHAGSLAAGLIMMRDFDSIGLDLLDLAVSFALDVCQLALFRLIAYLTLERPRRSPEAPLPARALILCAAIPSALQIVSRILYDVAVGAPTGKTDLIVMVTYYLIDLAGVAIGYLAILLISDRLSAKKERA